MKTGLVPNHDSMNVRGKLAGKLFEKDIHDLDVDIGGEHPDDVAGSRAGGADDIEPVVSRLTHRCKPFAPPCPAACQRALLAESSFILEVHFYSPVEVLAGDFAQCFRELFLKAAWALGSDFSWTGRGHR